MCKESFPTPNEGKVYSPEEDAFLTREYGVSDTAEIAEALGRTSGSVRTRAMRIKVRSDKAPTDIPEGKRFCRQCETIQSLDDFFNKRGSKDGKYSICRTCCSIIEKEKRDKKRIEKLTAETEKLKEIINEKTQEKNSKIIKCRLCGQDKPGTAYGFTNNTCEKLDLRCYDCRVEVNVKNKVQRIKDGRDW